AGVLVPDVELQHLERPLDDERRVGVHDRPQPRKSQAARNAEHELLADANVDHAVGMAPFRGEERGAADLRDPDRDARVRIDGVGGRRVEALAHRPVRHAGHAFGSTTAITACGRSSCRVASAASSPSWSRPSTVAVDQLSIAKRYAIPPGRPSEDERLSTTPQARRAMLATAVEVVAA